MSSIIRTRFINNLNRTWLLVERKFNSHSYYHNPGKEPLVYRTIGQQFDYAVEKYGDREAIVSCHDNQRSTFVEIQKKANNLAKGLLEMGFKKGDHIGIWSPNTINWYISFIATTKAGLVSVALNPAYQANEMAYCIKKVRLRGIIAYDQFKTQKYYDILKSVKDTSESKDAEMIKNLIIIIDSNTKYSDAHRLDDIVLYGQQQQPTIIKGPQCDDECNIQFTSGTTGQPKAAILSHHNIVNNGIFSGIRNELNERQHRICVQNPFFHAYGIVQAISAGMAHGSTLILPTPGYNPIKSLKSIVNERCTFLFGTPTMYVDLIACQRDQKLPIDTVEFALTGGAVCTQGLYKTIKETFRLKAVKNLYGLTETTASAFQSVANEGDAHVWNTVGYIQDHTEVKIVNEAGEIVPMGTPGELYIRGYQTMLQYFDDDAKTKEIISYDRWLKTGDQFILHQNGYGQIVGRFKEMIIRGGENIYPKEIESNLITHPDIIDAQVIGVPDERLGEELCAYVRTESGRIIERDEIEKYLKGKIAHFKIPRYVKTVSQFPTTTSGKIQKFKLRECFMANKTIL